MRLYCKKDCKHNSDYIAYTAGKWYVGRIRYNTRYDRNPIPTFLIKNNYGGESSFVDIIMSQAEESLIFSLSEYFYKEEDYREEQINKVI